MKMQSNVGLTISELFTCFIYIYIIYLKTELLDLYAKPLIRRPHGLYNPWNSLGQNTGVGSLSLLQGIFPTHGSNPGFSHCRQIFFLPVEPQGKPNFHYVEPLIRRPQSLSMANMGILL